LVVVFVVNEEKGHPALGVLKGIGVGLGVAAGRCGSPGMLPNLLEHMGAITAQKMRAKMVVWKSFMAAKRFLGS